MTKISQPGVSVAITSAVTEVNAQEQRVLFIGQKTSAGTASNGELISNIQNDNSWDTLFGENSMLADMIRNARGLNNLSQFDAIGLSDNGTGFATKVITASGTSAEDGAFVISIGSKNNHTVTAIVSTSDTATLVGDSIEAAINSDPTMPFTAVNAAGVVTLTAVNAGTYGNSIGVQITGAVAGISLIMADGTAGVVDPVLTNVFDVIGDTRYQTIVWPYPANTSALRTLLDGRFNATDDVLDGVGITTAIGSASSLSSDYAALNSQSLVVVGDTTDANGSSVNLVTNGTFDSGTGWSAGTGWTIGSGVAAHATGNTAVLSQSIAEGVDDGDSYFVQYDVAFTSGTGVTVSVGGAAGTVRVSSGTFIETIIAGSGNELIEFTPGSTFIGSVDNVQLFKITSNEINLKVPSIFEIPAVLSAEFGAMRALRRTVGANIVSFLAGEVGLDAFGGPALSSRPYFNTPFSALPVAPTGVGFTTQEVEDLLADGVSVMGNNTAANTVILGEIVTTYKTDAGGNPDQSFKFLNFVDTSSAVREYFFNNLRARFAQSRLTDKDLVTGRPMANEALILATLTEFYSTLSGAEFALTQAGEEARVTFRSNTSVTIDLATGVVTVLMQAVPLVTQLRQINATITISFSANG